MQIKSILLTIFAAAALVSAMDVDPAVEVCTNPSLIS
jgi:hypothetical protein